MRAFTNGKIRVQASVCTFALSGKNLALNRPACFRLTLSTTLSLSLWLAASAHAAPPAKPASAGPSLAYRIALTDGTSSVVRTRRELGVTSKNGTLAVDAAALKRALTRLAPKFHQDAQNAKPFVFKGKIKFDPGIQARALNVPTTAASFAKAIAAHPATKKFRVALDKKAPDLTVERLKNINGVLSTMQTITSEDAKRNENIKIATESIDGTFLSPGEVFSLNETVGKRTQARGFLTAHVFVDAKVVPGVGGGVSQVTGTLFNAAALAGLAIKEVNPHSRPVAYLPIGRDATVAYGETDLKFANNTKAPVYIAYSFANRHLRATLFGAKVPGRKITLRPVVQHLGPGKIDAQLYRVVKMNGKVTTKERLVTHKYRWTGK